MRALLLIDSVSDIKPPFKKRFTLPFICSMYLIICTYSYLLSYVKTQFINKFVYHLQRNIDDLTF